jgi:hypothetical protein
VRIEDGAEAGLAVVRLADQARVGKLNVHAEGDDLVVDALCIDDAERSYGCGSDAGWLLVRAAKDAGFRVTRAHAPPSRGLAVYFWIRMGLRPRHGEGPGGGIWFERRLTTD